MTLTMLILYGAAIVVPILFTVPSIRRADRAFERHLFAIRHNVPLAELNSAHIEHMRAQRKSTLHTVAAMLVSMTLITLLTIAT